MRFFTYSASVLSILYVSSLCFPPQPVHAERPAADRPILRPPQRLPGDRLGRVEPVLQNLRGSRVPERQPHSEQAGASVPGGRGSGVPAPGGVGVVRASG